MAFERWLSKLRDVNPSGEAPHKPLLTVLKAAERDGEVPDQAPLNRRSSAVVSVCLAKNGISS